MKEYFYYDLNNYENGTILDSVENGVWKYGMEYFRIYGDAITCCSNEARNAKGYVYLVEPIATVYDSELPHRSLTTALKIKKISDITFMMEVFYE